MKRAQIGLAAVAAVIIALAGGLAYRLATRPTDRASIAARIAPQSNPTTQSQSSPTQPAPAEVNTFIDVVRSAYPKLPTTRPLMASLPLPDAARLTLPDPIYLGPNWRPDLWITRTDAPPIEQTLRAASDPQADAQVFVVPEQVVFAHWNLTEFGQWQVRPIVRTSDGGFAIVSAAGRQSLPPRTDYLWDRAVSLESRLVVPTSTGVCVFGFEPRVVEQFFDLRDPNAAAPPAPPLTMYDGAGLLAWMPSEAGRQGGRAARYIEGNWTDLSKDPAWQGKFVQLLPLRDGSVLQIRQAESGGNSVNLALVSLQQITIGEGEITSLVAQLSDPERETREAAFAALGQYGPGIHPTLQRLAASQPPEARARLRQLLRKSVRPALGSYTLVGDELRLVNRQADGGAVFYAPQGVSILGENSDPVIEAPAWLAMRPGRAVELLPRAMTLNLNPSESHLYPTIDGWVAAGDAGGPRWWVGNNFVPLLEKEQRDFSEFLGRDRRGRWLFRKPGAAGAAPTLIIDPTLPDPRPRLPAWLYKNTAEVGWDSEGWPAAAYLDAHYVLGEDGWRKMPDGGEMKTAVDAPAPPTTAAATTRSRNDLVLALPDGTNYYDGKSRIVMEKPNGQQIDWPLPPIANGPGPVILLRAGDGKLFLFNQPGRVLRLSENAAGDGFEVDATFTAGVPPTFAELRRIWLDPAGRIVIANGNSLSLLFPNGYIPAKLRELMDVQP